MEEKMDGTGWEWKSYVQEWVGMGVISVPVQSLLSTSDSILSGDCTGPHSAEVICGDDQVPALDSLTIISQLPKICKRIEY